MGGGRQAVQQPTRPDQTNKMNGKKNLKNIYLAYEHPVDLKTKCLIF